MTYLLLALIVLVSATACGGDDGDGQRACIVGDSCFESEGGNEGAHIGLCDSLDGTLSDGCTQPLVGCCAHGGVRQCFYEVDGDAEALADICASQMGTWSM